MVSPLECWCWGAAAFRSGRQLPCIKAGAAALPARYEKLLGLATCGVGSCQMIAAQLKFQSKQSYIEPYTAEISATPDVGRTDPRFPDRVSIMQGSPLLYPPLGTDLDRVSLTLVYDRTI